MLLIKTKTNNLIKNYFETLLFFEALRHFLSRRKPIIIVYYYKKSKSIMNVVTKMDNLWWSTSASWLLGNVTLSRHIFRSFLVGSTGHFYVFGNVTFLVKKQATFYTIRWSREILVSIHKFISCKKLV